MYTKKEKGNNCELEWRNGSLDLAANYNIITRKHRRQKKMYVERREVKWKRVLTQLLFLFSNSWMNCNAKEEIMSKGAITDL